MDLVSDMNLITNITILVLSPLILLYSFGLLANQIADQRTQRLLMLVFLLFAALLGANVGDNLNLTRFGKVLLALDQVVALIGYGCLINWLRAPATAKTMNHLVRLLRRYKCVVVEGSIVWKGSNFSYKLTGKGGKKIVSYTEQLIGKSDLKGQNIFQYVDRLLLRITRDIAIKTVIIGPDNHPIADYLRVKMREDTTWRLLDGKSDG